MKKLPAILLSLISPALVFAQSTPAPELTGEWTRIQVSPYFWAEGACAADVNHDGKADLLSGPYWYAGPDFKEKHSIYPAGATFKAKDASGAEQTIPGFEGALGTENKYSDNFLSYTADFNGDGWADYLVIGFPGKETLWYENPKGQDSPWPKHVALDVTDNESPMFVDITGDGKPELLCMSGGFIGYAEPPMVSSIAPDQRDAVHLSSKVEPRPGTEWSWHPISTKGPYQRYTHGIGAGDINGDGRVDILEARGWWEQPSAGSGDQPWTFHEVLFSPKGGSQMYVYDVNGDGKNDVITALEAHGYGVAWFEQTNEGGEVGFTRHLITGTPTEKGESGLVFSQPHAIDFVDMNGDGLKDIVTGKRFWAHGSKGDAESGAAAVLWWFELKRENGKATWIAATALSS